MARATRQNKQTNKQRQSKGGKTVSVKWQTSQSNATEETPAIDEAKQASCCCCCCVVLCLVCCACVICCGQAKAITVYPLFRTQSLLLTLPPIPTNVMFTAPTNQRFSTHLFFGCCCLLVVLCCVSNTQGKGPKNKNDNCDNSTHEEACLLVAVFGVERNNKKRLWLWLWWCFGVVDLCCVVVFWCCDDGTGLAATTKKQNQQCNQPTTTTKGEVEGGKNTHTKKASVRKSGKV